ncbi:haloacid dehalogenase [Kordiimonas sediminis]|uniref:Haloacid dehalogenase n=1 Tax=Kordiimonas sediminis TaxID=1735581 RepID=A0A919E6G9_9PROT|nr:TIGR01459 family HAD-type hydrolase [Kordiimonas sediminis]GHF17038.1 haloacid dehalogenase [Kordiimonas sediminis]
MSQSPLETVQPLASLGEWQDDLDLIICDLWGVMHDGIVLHPAADNALVKARQAGITTVFLSNAPRPRDHVRSLLASMGMTPALLDNIVTSGGLARDVVRQDYKGAALYHLGPDEDHNTVEGLDVRLMESPENADVILATGLDYRDVADHKAYLTEAAAKGVPFLCANPDRVVHVGEKLYTCAGAVADLYSDMGGPVTWFGKPIADSLRACIGEAGLDTKTIHPDRIVMIGDSLQTDIAGAHAAGVRSILVGGGIHREHLTCVSAYMVDSQPIPHKDFSRVFGEGKPIPDALIEQLVWL